MEVRHRIIEMNSPKCDLLRKELDKLGSAYKVKDYGSIGGLAHRSVEFIIAENDPLFPVIAELISRHHFHVQVGVDYSQEDMEAAEWYYINAGEYQYPQPEDDFAFREVTYDTSALCRRCGMGAVQAWPFRLKHTFTQRAQFLGLYWVFDEVFVRREAKAILERAQVSGVEFLHPVYHKTGQDVEDVWQMTVRIAARPGLVTEGLETVTCKPDNEERIGNRMGDYPYCGRVKYHYPRRDAIKFRADVLSELPDIAKSHEYLGTAYGAHRLVLVRNRVYRLVSDHMLRALKFTPIVVV